MFTDHTSNPNKHRVNSFAMRNGSGVAGLEQNDYEANIFNHFYVFFKPVGTFSCIFIIENVSIWRRICIKFIMHISCSFLCKRLSLYQGILPFCILYIFLEAVASL